jgi:CrcB protein
MAAGLTEPTSPNEPFNCDVDCQAEDVRRWRASGPAVIVATGLGGVIGAEARYGITKLQPAGDTFPYATFGINVAGCAAIGALLAVLSRMRDPSPLLRPFLATGVLGGFTTVSTYALDGQRLIMTGHPGTALAYIFGTLAASLAAVAAAAQISRPIAAFSRRRGRA